MRRSGVSSGWNAVASAGPWRTATILPVRASVPTISTSVAGLLHPRRPDEHGPEFRAPGTPRARCRSRTSPPGGRTRSAGRSCRSRRTSPGPAIPSSTRSASMIIPAQEPNAGRPDAEPLAQRLHQVEDHRELPHRGGLAARDHQPGHARRARRACAPGTGRAPTAARAARCSATSPCSASTPTAGPCAGAWGRVAFRETVTRYHSSLTLLNRFHPSQDSPRTVSLTTTDEKRSFTHL